MENNENKKERMYLLNDCLRSSFLSWIDPSSQERPRIGQKLDVYKRDGKDPSTSVWLGPRVQIGNNVGLEPDLVIEEDAVIGDDVIVPYGSRIGARTKLYSSPHYSDRSLHLGADNEIGHSCKIFGPLTTGNDCKIGNNTDLWLVDSLGNNIEIGNNCYVGKPTLPDRVKFYDHVKVYKTSIDTDSMLCEHVESHADKIGKNVLIGAYAKLDRGVEIADNLEILPNAQIPGGVHITATEIIEHYRRDEDDSLKRVNYPSRCQIYERESDIPQNANRKFSAWRKRTPLKKHPLGQYVRLRKPLEDAPISSQKESAPSPESSLLKASPKAQAKVPKSAPESTLIRVWRMLNPVFK